MQPLAFRRVAERVGRLTQVVLKQPGFGEGTAELERFVAAETRRFQDADEQRRRIRPVAF